MSCKDCLNRREFLAKSALAAAALAVIDGCGDGQIGPTAVGTGGVFTIKVADFPNLASTNVLVDVGHICAVKRTGAATFVALSRECTHEGCEAFVRSNRIVCDCHGSIFSVTGSVIQGPANRPLDTLATQFDATAGTLTIG